MNSIIPEEIRSQMTVDDDTDFAMAWDCLGEAFPDAPTARMNRQLRKEIRYNRHRRWMPALAMAGATAILVAGIAVGRLIAPAAQSPADFKMDARLLSGESTALRLEAMVNLRRVDSDLTMAIIDRLGQIIASDQASVGMRLAATETLTAHSVQPEVQAMIQQLLGWDRQNPLITERLKEASGITSTATI